MILPSGKTNLEMLFGSIEKAKNEWMNVIKSGEVDSKDYIVTHNDKAYIVRVSDNNEILSCNCGQCQVRNQICKHMIKVSMDKKLNIKILTF